MTEVLERLFRYVQIDTQSEEDISDRTPTTEKQWDLARLLEKEMLDLGLEDVSLNNKCFVTGTLPANTKKEIPVIGFLAHIDTSPDFSGKDVKPQIIENYDGKDIPLKGEKGMCLSPQEFPDLLKCKGKTLITSDGTTLLGADDKAGIAEIMTAIAYLIQHPEIEHGRIRIAFTPDEEVGLGIRQFDVKNFKADYAYTLDGGDLGELEYESFNAARAVVNVQGKSVHPGDAKDVMINAINVLYEFNSMLPTQQRPEHTEGREGYFHLMKLTADNIDKARAVYLVRDHDTQKFKYRKELMQHSADFINKKYGAGTVKVELEEQYRNMREVLDRVPHVVETAKQAMLELDIEPISKPIRGGTDGSQLCFMGLPTPNIFAGGFNAHGPYEFACVEFMEKAVEVILKIIDLYTKR